MVHSIIIFIIWYIVHSIIVVLLWIYFQKYRREFWHLVARLIDSENPTAAIVGVSWSIN